MNNEDRNKRIERLNDLTQVIWEVKEALRQSETLIEEVQEEGFVLSSGALEWVEEILYDFSKYNESVGKKLTYMLVKEYKELGEKEY